MNEYGKCIIVVKDLVKKYGEYVAVDHISFCVRRGEIFGFLGPNGAGKTTTIRMLSGLTRITGGKAVIDGYSVVEEHRMVKKVIGVVPDTPNLYSELTCLENLVFCGEMYGIPREERTRRAIELLRFFDLWKVRDLKFKELSRGLKKRLSIAAALIHDPRILFLDEPTTGLDVVSKRLLWRKIRMLNEKGVTIFLTTHNVREAFEVCDRIAFISRGRIVAIGSPHELRRMFSVEGVIEVSFQPKNPRIDEIHGLPGVESVEERRGVIRIAVSNTIDALEALLKFVKNRGFEIYMLSLKDVDAEELFIKIIGGS